MAPPVTISSLLSNIDKISSKKDRVEALRQLGTVGRYAAHIQYVLKMAYHPQIKWLLPEGPAPFKTTDALDQEGRLYSELRRLYLFVEGGNPNLKPTRREFLFIQLLESIDAEDANLLNHMKDKKLPYKNISYKLVQEAFPELLPEVNKNVKSKGEVAT